MEHTIIQDEKICRFEIFGTGQIAYLQYREVDGELEIVRTYVPPQLEGQGVGRALVDAAVRYANRKNLAVKPTCSFAKEYLNKEGV